jgi:hypothetical protein
MAGAILGEGAQVGEFGIDGSVEELREHVFLQTLDRPGRPSR